MATIVQAVQATLGYPKLAVSGSITEADTGNTVQAVEIPAKSFVPPGGVTVYVAEVFAGGTPSLDVGDGDDVDGWVDSTDITETTVGTYSGDLTNTAAYSADGKYYAAADTIDVVVAASATGGTAYVLVAYYDLSDVTMAAE